MLTKDKLINPNTTKCKHFPTRNYFFIFPCCDKSYICYQCHNIQEDHLSSGKSICYCKVCLKWHDSIQLDDTSRCSGCQTNFMY